MRTAVTLFLCLFCSICFAAPHQKITYLLAIDREYVVYTPSTYQADQPRGLMIFLHELGGDVDRHEALAQNFADTYGWVIAMPQSLKFLNLDASWFPNGTFPDGIEQVLNLAAWNSGMKASTLKVPIKEAISQYITNKLTLAIVNAYLDVEFKVWESTKDEDFIIDMLKQIQKDYAVASDSIYVSGMSMGGLMTHRMLINKGQYFKAGVAVSGIIGDALMDQQPKHGTHPRVMHIHGTRDGVVGYDGYAGFYDFEAQVGLGAEETVEYWRSYNQCDEIPEVYYYPNLVNDGMTFERYDYNNGIDNSCAAFIKVNNGHHEWYGAFEGKDINYMQEIYTFCANKQSGTGPTTNIESISNEMPLLPRKVMNNGKIVIINGGHSYDLLGQPLK